jgi:hypothetical protein
LTPPGQAILVRGVETVKVMTPYLPDDERAQRLARLREGEVEFTELQRKTLEAVRQLQATGHKITNKAVYKLVGSNFVQFSNRIKSLRQQGLSQSLPELDDGTDTTDTN